MDIRWASGIRGTFPRARCPRSARLLREGAPSAPPTAAEPGARCRSEWSTPAGAIGYARAARPAAAAGPRPRPAQPSPVLLTWRAPGLTVDLLYFVLLVSSLIFIHESGHFAFAKIFGVKVLTFSIGFGPKVLRIRGKETEYCVGLLPFGGFVKMLEESKQSEPILPEDRQRTFEAQALWKRVVIVLAGPGDERSLSDRALHVGVPRGRAVPAAHGGRRSSRASRPTGSSIRAIASCASTATRSRASPRCSRSSRGGPASR